METDALPWDVCGVYSMQMRVTDKDCDRFGHTNNAVYLRWLERVAWAHTESLGLGFETYERLGTGCVVRRHELDYLATSFAGEDLRLGTWIAENDGRLSMWRAYQIIRVADTKTLLRGRTRFVCVDLVSGKPRRQPQAFIDAYRPIG